MFLLLFLLSHINGILVPIMSYPDHPAVGLLNGKHREPQESTGTESRDIIRKFPNIKAIVQRKTRESHKNMNSDGITP